MNSRRESKILELSLQNQQIKPWNSVHMQKYTHRPKAHKSIFALSNRNSIQRTTHKKTAPTIQQRIKMKPNTAPDSKNKRVTMTNQLTKLGNIPKQQMVGQNFEQQFQNMQLYANFRPSVQQKKQLIFLKPYMKRSLKYNSCKAHRMQNPTQAMQKLKTQIYKNIYHSQNLENHLKISQIYLDNSQVNVNSSQNRERRVTCNKSFIEYFTEYEGENTYRGKQMYSLRNNYGQYEKRRAKNKSMSVMKDKLKNYYKHSKYIANISQVRNGPGLPVTIIK